jgi:hypothetical protein
MGSFYTNITLRTTDTDRVEAGLRQARRSALIAPPDKGCTVVFDAASEDQDIEVLRALAIHLSRACKCPALAVLNHDDDVLVYLLYENGELLDEYNSAPSYFDDEADPGAPPTGGDAQRLSATFGVPGRASELERILRATTAADDGFVFAMDRHRELTDALGTPSSAVGAGYTYLEQGEFPEGIEASVLRRV